MTQMDRQINTFAVRSFRDMADGDYIAARMAWRARLLPQFKWSAQQAIEKYLKCILLMHRVPAKNVNHDIAEALKKTKELPFEVVLRPFGRGLVDHLAIYGEYRYLDVSNFTDGHDLPKLDMAVWDLRRYCQVLHVIGEALPDAEQKLLEESLLALKNSNSVPPNKFRLRDGMLETVLADKAHPSHRPLIYQNAFFGNRSRKKISSRAHFQTTNAPLWLYPQMLDELLKYVKIGKLEGPYREHLKKVLAEAEEAARAEAAESPAPPHADFDSNGRPTE